MPIAEVFARRTVSMEVAPCRDTCLVSFWSTIAFATENYGQYPIEFDGWKDTLRIDCDDVTSLVATSHSVRRFSLPQAEELFEFIETHNGSDFVIHCDAGMSRSVAVGAFLRDFYGYDARFYETKHDEHRNIWIYNLLRRRWMRSNRTDVEETNMGSTDLRIISGA